MMTCDKTFIMLFSFFFGNYATMETIHRVGAVIPTITSSTSKSNIFGEKIAQIKLVVKPLEWFNYYKILMRTVERYEAFTLSQITIIK